MTITVLSVTSLVVKACTFNYLLLFYLHRLPQLVVVFNLVD